MISVVVADDHPFVLHGVANVLRSNSEITVVTACNDGSAAWSCRFCSRNARGCSNAANMPKELIPMHISPPIVETMYRKLGGRHVFAEVVMCLLRK